MPGMVKVTPGIGIGFGPARALRPKPLPPSFPPQDPPERPVILTRALRVNPSVTPVPVQAPHPGPLVARGSHTRVSL